MIVTNIDWDIDPDECEDATALLLQTELVIPKNITSKDVIADSFFDVTGWHCTGFSIIEV